jgi:tetratricopeptide (TPR) repeat protein
LNDQREIAVTYSNIGTLYSEQDDHLQALSYILKTKTKLTKRLKDSTGLMIDLYNIGSLCRIMNKLDSALFCCSKLIQLPWVFMTGIMSERSRWHLDIYINRKITCHLRRRFFQKGIVYAKRCKKTAKLISSAYAALADIAERQGFTDPAIFYARQSLMSAKQGSVLKNVMNASLLLSDLFRKTRRFDSALYYHETAMVMKDSLFNIEKIKQIQNLAYNDNCARGSGRAKSTGRN